MKSLFASNIIFLLAGVLSCKTMNAQQKNTGTSYSSRRFSYHSITLFTGADLLIPHKDNGLLQVSFPYTIKANNGTMTSNNFVSPSKKVYNPTKLLLLPFGFEVGGLHHFFKAGIAVQLFYEGYSNSTNSSAGYGHIWYLDGIHHHDKEMEKKSFVIKSSINISYNVDGGGNKKSLLGIIDNENNVINLFNYIANPTYTVKATRPSSVGKFSAKNLDISYTQREFSLVPMITISPNPFKGGRPIYKSNYPTTNYKKFTAKLLWELSLGYNIALYDQGGILLNQDDGNLNDKTNKVGGPIHLDNKALSTYFNNQKTTSTPYHFSGFYVSIMFYIVRSKIK